MISAAILAEARAARRGRRARRRRASAAPANPLLALWRWLARPPVAAGFAERHGRHAGRADVVGPADGRDLAASAGARAKRSEARHPSAPVDATITTAAPAAATAPTAPAAPAPPATVPTAPAQSPPTPARVAPAREARLGVPTNAEARGRKTTRRAKERDARRRRRRPRRSRRPRSSAPAGPRPRPSAQDAKKEADATPAPTTPPAPLASNRADVGAAAGASAKSAAPSGSMTAPARNTPAPPAAAPLARQRSIAEARPSEADAFASSGAGTRSERASWVACVAMAPRRSHRCSPRSPTAASRWTRQTASGGSTAVETVWRDWLADLDAQARWRRVTDSAQPSAPTPRSKARRTLRLDLDGRPAALIRSTARPRGSTSAAPMPAVAGDTRTRPPPSGCARRWRACRPERSGAAAGAGTAGAVIMLGSPFLHDARLLRRHDHRPRQRDERPVSDLGTALIRVRGARTHNLKNVDLDIPRNRLVVITGLSAPASRPSPSTRSTPRASAATSSRSPRMRGSSSSSWRSPTST